MTPGGTVLSSARQLVSYIRDVQAVGANLRLVPTLKAKGIYKITMVKQAPDDNHLKLTIK